MKHLIGSLPFLLQIKGFRHGAGAEPMNPSDIDSAEYGEGYRDGQKARAAYIEDLCRKNSVLPKRELVTTCRLLVDQKLTKPLYF